MLCNHGKPKGKVNMDLQCLTLYAYKHAIMAVINIISNE